MLDFGKAGDTLQIKQAAILLEAELAQLLLDVDLQALPRLPGDAGEKVTCRTIKSSLPHP